VKGGQHTPADKHQEQGIQERTFSSRQVTAISPQLFAESSAIKLSPTTTAAQVAPPGVAARDARTPGGGAAAAKVRAPRLFKASPDSARRMTVKQQQNVAPATKSWPPGKATGYDLVGVQIHKLARQAKLLETGSVLTTRQRFS